MNRTTMITALACGLLLTATPALAAQSDQADGSSRAIDEQGSADHGDGDTLLINGRAFLLE